MSRCFPFPPPGFEKNVINDHYLEIVKKEKCREKKHKKDNTKGEHKQQEDRYGSTDNKHKKKKDWKEKQKEKYRKTNRDYNNREAKDSKKERKVSDEKIIKNQEGLKEQKCDESIMQVETSKTPTFSENFDRKVQTNSTGKMFQNLAPDVHNGLISRKIDLMGSSFSQGKATKNEENCTRKKMFQSMTGDKDRRTRYEEEEEYSLCGPTGERRVLGISNAQDVRISDDGMVEKVTSLKSECKMGGSLEKDGKREKVNNSNKRTADPVFDSQTQDQPKNGVRDKNNKRKEGTKAKEKKKEKHKMRREKLKHKYIKDSRKEQGDASPIKPLNSLMNPNKRAESDGSLKRKEPDNLYSHDYDTQPNKLSRTATPLLDERNISRSNFSSDVLPHTSDLNEITNATSPIEKILSKDNHTNGTRESMISSVTYAHPSADESDACEVSTRPVHTDSQYLRQIYSVPEEMEELSDTDDKEWLFRNNMLRLKPDSKFMSEEMTLTWDRVVWNETTGVITLPYVIPY